MKIGFVSGSLKDLDLASVVRFAGENGFKALEISARPEVKHLNIAELAEGKVKEVMDLQERYDVRISSLLYGAQHLHPDKKVRDESHEYMKKMVLAAKYLDGPVVSAFVGRDPSVSIEENLKRFKEEWPPLVDFAEKHGVKIAIENCYAGGYNIGAFPQVWEEMFSIIPSPAWGLNFDPSHLVWQGIDYIKAVHDFGKRIYHAHAKDTEIMEDKLKKYGIYSQGWWRYRIPGRGLVDWCGFIDALEQESYDHVISIEHEDPVWEGSIEKVEKGLIMAKRHLEQFI